MQISSLVILFLSFIALLIPTTTAAVCNSTELTTALLPLYTNANYSGCVSDVGTPLPFAVPPTTEQIAAMCESSACKALTPIVISLNLPDCEVIVNGVVYNVLLVRARRIQQCSSSSYSSNITASVPSSGSGSDSSTTYGP